MKTPDVGKAWGSQCPLLCWGDKLYSVSAGTFAHYFIYKSFLKELCFDLAILLPGCTLKSKIFFIPVLFITGENWKFLKCSMRGNWVNRWCHTHRWEAVQKLNIMLLKDIKDMRKHSRCAGKWKGEVIKQHESNFIQCQCKYARYVPLIVLDWVLYPVLRTLPSLSVKHHSSLAREILVTARGGEKRLKGNSLKCKQ